MQKVMQARDAVSAKLAECFVTIEGNRYLLLQAKKFEAKFEKEKQKISILGKTGQGNKATSWSGTGNMTIYHNTPIFNDLMLRFKDSGEDVYFDIQVSNEDSTARGAGRQTMIFKGCNIDGGLLASFDADGDSLEQDVDFTFEDFEMPEKFKMLDGMM
ncbi:phage tail tube protein [Anaerospora hongkongensis]|uniref:phage tail tube protein n=1 Tax=Anaerospora hongkongensis TaxID=244830 RepID=UPI0028A04A38|nr:phage tail tube protein [Anaerospora hongkongensis]